MGYKNPRLGAFNRLLQTLQTSERAPPAQLHQYQQGTLRRLMGHARNTDPLASSVQGRRY
jgi:hypothetical protein